MKLFVEKTGCDAATLSAPFLLHGNEAGLMKEAGLESDTSIHLSFTCEELLVSASPHIVYCAVLQYPAEN